MLRRTGRSARAQHRRHRHPFPVALHHDGHLVTGCVLLQRIHVPVDVRDLLAAELHDDVSCLKAGPGGSSAFPDAGEVSPGNLRTESLGFVYFAEWPWVYSYSIGWAWIQDPGSPDAPGNWVYLPKPQ